MLMVAMNEYGCANDYDYDAHSVAAATAAGEGAAQRNGAGARV